MKKLYSCLILLSFTIINAQTYTFKIELDDSQYYEYMKTYYKLESDRLNQSIARQIKSIGDEYVKRVNDDLNFINENSSYLIKPELVELNQEINRLKKIVI